MASVDVTRIASNISALNTLKDLQNVNNQLATHQARLSTGKRINTAADDPAGLSVVNTFDIRRQEMKTSLNAISDGKNQLSVAESGLSNMQNILTKMRDKAVEAGGENVSAAEREAINTQLQSFRDELDNIATNTQWNGKNLLSGADGKGQTEAINIGGPTVDNGAMNFSFQSTQETYSSASSAITGANGATGSTKTLLNANQGFNASTGNNDGNSISAEGLGLSNAALEITTTTTTNAKGETSTANNVSDVVSKIDVALKAVDTGRNQVSSFNARLTFKEETLAVQSANTEAAYSRIMNANMAEEQVNASRFSILQQTSTAMLAQANTAPQFLLSLFR